MIKMDQFMMASGMKIRNLVEEKCSFLMAPSMMAAGREIRCTDKEFLYHVREIATKAILTMESRLDMVP